jgi:hypothetical protein
MKTNYTYAIKSPRPDNHNCRFFTFCTIPLSYQWHIKTITITIAFIKIALQRFPTFFGKKKVIRAVSVSCPKLNHNHLDPTHRYKDNVRDLKLSQRCRWRFKASGGLPDPEDKGTIILRKVRYYLPIDMVLTSTKTLQFQRNNLSFKMDNISGSRSNSQITSFSVIHYDAVVWISLLILQASPFSLCSFSDPNDTRCLKIRVRSFL